MKCSAMEIFEMYGCWHPCTQCSEIHLVDAADRIGQLGGVLGLYIGASLQSMFHLSVFVERILDKAFPTSTCKAVASPRNTTITPEISYKRSWLYFERHVYTTEHFENITEHWTSWNKMLQKYSVVSIEPGDYSFIICNNLKS